MRITINKWVVIGILIFLVVIGFYFLFYKSLENEKATLMESIETNRQMLLKYQLNYKRSVEEWEKFKESLQKFSEIQEKLPTKEDLPNLLAFVESIAKESKLSVNTFRPIREEKKVSEPSQQTQGGTQKEVKPQYEERNYSLDIQGSYGGFLLFLAKLKTAPRLILLKDLKIDPVDVTAKELKFSFVISTFIIK